MKKPIIAIIAARAEHDEDIIDRVAVTYTQAVVDHGGIPIILPNVPESIRHFLSHVDGVMMPGGIDVHPGSYNEEVTFSEGMMKEKDDIDREIITMCLESNTPLLAICRGLQMVNVTLGGTLIQDIAKETQGSLNHSQSNQQYETVHDVIVEGSRYLPDGTFPVNSMHHQSIKKLGNGLKITGNSPDGIIEMIEMPDYKGFFLGVEWHPECIANEPLSKKIFTAFIDSAAARKSQR